MNVIDTQIFDIKETHKTPEGFLSIPAYIARAGVQEYNTDEPFMKVQLSEFPKQFRKPGLIIRVMRPLDEVLHPESMKSFRSRPITNDHPDDLVTIDNASSVTVGLSDSNVISDNGMIKTNLTIWDKNTIKDIEAGKNQISAGYRSEIVWESGSDNEYGPYDAKFTDIRANHIAIVQCGRAGSAVKLLDAKQTERARKMAKRMIGNVELEISDDKVGVIDALLSEKLQLENVIQGYLTTIEANKREIADTKKAIDVVTGEKDALEAKINDGVNIDKLVETRVAILDVGKKFIKDFDPKGKTNDEIKIEILSSTLTGINLKEKSIEYIDAAFDVFLETNVTDKSAVRSAMNVAANDDSWKTAADKAREKMIENSRNMYKGGN